MSDKTENTGPDSIDQPAHGSDAAIQVKGVTKRFGAHVAVETGLEQGDSIVVDGMNRLGAATNVTIRPSR